MKVLRGEIRKFFVLRFILAMKAPSLILIKTNKSGFINVYQGKDKKKGRRSLTCSNMILIFCDARKGNLEYLNWILMWFQASVGLKIYLEKSEFIPTKEVSNVADLKKGLGCKVGVPQITY